jgi:hypothetical protein
MGAVEAAVCHFLNCPSSGTNNRNVDLFDVQSTQLIVDSLLNLGTSITLCVEFDTLIPNSRASIISGNLNSDVLQSVLLLITL